GYRGRGHADPLDRRPRGRARPDHEGHPDGVLRDHPRPLAALGRVPGLPGGRARALLSATTTIGLSAPDIGAREEELVLEALRSGVLGLGPMLRRFERDFAA